MIAYRAAQALAAVLNEHNIPGRWAGPPVRGPRTITIGISLARTADLDRVLALDEAVALRAGLERVRIARVLATVVAEFELPRSAWRPVALADLPPGRGLALGLSTRGQPVRADLADPATPHLLIAGATGCGKTTLLRSLVYQAAEAGRPLHLVDAKAELVPLYPRAAAVLTRADRAATHLADIARNLRQHSGAIIAIDELAALIYADPGAAKAVGQIASLGRSLDVHLICGTQRVDKATLGDRMITDNMARIAGRVLDAQASVLATGQAGLAAHRLSGSGDMLLVRGDQAIRFVAAVADLPEPPPAPLAADEADEPDLDGLAEWRAVGRLLAASAVRGREISSRLAKEVLSIGNTDRARRMRDYATAVLRGIEEGGAAVIAEIEPQEPQEGEEETCEDLAAY